MESQAIERGLIASVDKWFARRFARGEEERLFVAFLLAASRAGHLCVAVTDEGIDPSPDRFGWEAGPLWEAIEQGARSLEPSEELVFDRGRWYLARFFRAERIVVDQIRRLTASTPPPLSSGIEQARSWLAERVATGQLLPEQAKGIESVVENQFTLLSGGPGTGKSYTASFLLALFQELGDPALRIAVAAPTGKAVGNLRRSLASLDMSRIELATLHTLLKVGHSVWDLDRIPSRIEADLVVVDEASMIDVALFSHLLLSVKPGARLLLMGDPDQLPPVEAGSLFGDLIATMPSTRLTRCLRAELKEIVDLSHEIRLGDGEAVLNRCAQGQAVSLHPLADAASIAQFGIEQFGSDVDSFGHFCLLSPLRKGPLGALRINEKMVEMALSRRSGPVRLPILICRNDHRLALSNGEVGVMVCHGDPYRPHADDYALFALHDKRAPFADTEANVRKIPMAMVPRYEHAFCISIHKSQGSEFDQVAVVVPEGGEALHRELLYTAVTRAKQKIDLLGEGSDLLKALAVSSKRRSGLT